MTQLEYAYFPGCSAGSTGIAYTKSTDYVGAKIGLKMHEITQWCCCGTSAAKLTDADLTYALPARSLAKGEQEYPGLDVIAPCTGCYTSLKTAAAWARESEENRAHVSDLIGMDYQANAEVKSLLEVMVEPEVTQLVVENLSRTLGGMKLACYYGCAQVRPVGLVNFENPENPMAMERLLNAAGAECVDWAFKTECCGASNHITTPKASRKLVERILRNAQANGAEALVCACPLCWLNLDLRESQINRDFNTNYHIPVFYFTELLALAMGADATQAGLNHHVEPCEDYVASKLEAVSKDE